MFLCSPPTIAHRTYTTSRSVSTRPGPASTMSSSRPSMLTAVRRSSQPLYLAEMNVPPMGSLDITSVGNGSFTTIDGISYYEVVLNGYERLEHMPYRLPTEPHSRGREHPRSGGPVPEHSGQADPRSRSADPVRRVLPDDGYGRRSQADVRRQRYDDRCSARLDQTSFSIFFTLFDLSLQIPLAMEHVHQERRCVLSPHLASILLV